MHVENRMWTKPAHSALSLKILWECAALDTLRAKNSRRDLTAEGFVIDRIDTDRGAQPAEIRQSRRPEPLADPLKEISVVTACCQAKAPMLLRGCYDQNVL